MSVDACFREFSCLLLVCDAAWEGVFGMATTQSFTSTGSVNYADVMANIYNAYRSGTFAARRAGHYFIELCAGAQVTTPDP